MPLRKKIQSKRQTLHHKYKVEKKVREATRKARKEAALGGGKKLKKDPGIPNLWPLKEQFIQKLQNQKAKLEEETARQKEDRKREHMKRRQEMRKGKGMEALAANASSRSEEFETKQSSKKSDDDYSTNLPSHLQFKDGSKKAYYREFKKIVENADVILEVLDARDPLGCRCVDVEQKILAKDSSKKIILVLNKIDLVPKENVEEWLKHLRNEYPTVAFKCSTQQQKKNLGHTNASIKDPSAHALESSECLGAETLLQLLKNYSRNMNLKTAVTVGIIGYPNVGKSSLINSLKRSRAVGVGSTPGFTKTVQQIHLDKHIKLLDCPGIVFGNTTNSDNEIILRNCVKVEQIPDPIEPVNAILKRAKQSQLLEIYKLSRFSTTNEFLLQIAQKRGKLNKGGIIDLEAAARSILQDWNAGKIPFYTNPPKPKANVHLSSSIVPSYGKEFDIESLLQQEQTDLSNLSNVDSKHLMMEPGTADSMMDELEEVEMADMLQEEKEDEEAEDMEDDIEPQIEQLVKSKANLKKTGSTTPTVVRKKSLLDPEESAANPQAGKANKKKFKKMVKNNKKFNPGESYDFGEYFGEDDDKMEYDDDNDVKLGDI